VVTPSMAYALVKLRTGSAVLAKLFPAGASVTAFAAALHVGLLFTFTALGLILGMVLLAMDGEGGALGSPNAPYTLFVFGLVVAIVAPVFVLMRDLRGLTAVNALAAILAFGWLMPYMARWAP
jgi:hypothetical protein